MGFLTRIVGIVYTFVETGLPQFLVEFVLFNLKFSIQCFVNHSVTFRLRFFRLAIALFDLQFLNIHLVSSEFS